MARIFNGITGQFQGKVGTVVGATWKGIPYMRSLPKKRTGVVSAKESANRLKFAMAHHWLAPLVSFVREGFKGYSPTVEGFLAAKSWLLKNAFELNDKQPVINPAKVKLSHGTLPLAANIAVQQSGPYEITFTWDPSTPDGGHMYDQVMLLAYDIQNGLAFSKTIGQFRNVGADTVGPLRAGIWHLYAAFRAADRSGQSDSVYLGTVTLL